ncbi:hypothetical protein BpHYR1_008423 [Brachionus plicatilis]|uniref:Uncharacterized protein n=1 Tax=Brachionus plicatilis TaxID=10195 RepID=A0A3M7SC05_BRAPC|nr:hypothetical protein BpHYR1_008423 [Brachionus plicatilis]
MSDVELMMPFNGIKSDHIGVLIAFVHSICFSSVSYQDLMPVASTIDSESSVFVLLARDIVLVEMATWKNERPTNQHK